jgi:hypothetical protein
VNGQLPLPIAKVDANQMHARARIVLVHFKSAAHCTTRFIETLVSILQTGPIQKPISRLQQSSTGAPANNHGRKGHQQMMFRGTAYKATVDQLAAEMRDAFDENNIDLTNKEIRAAICLTARQILDLVEKPSMVMLVGMDGIVTMLEAHQ